MKNQIVRSAEALLVTIISGLLFSANVGHADDITPYNFENPHGLMERACSFVSARSKSDGVACASFTKTYFDKNPFPCDSDERAAFDVKMVLDVCPRLSKPGLVSACF
jgi:hypothetical protein